MNNLLTKLKKKAEIVAVGFKGRKVTLPSEIIDAEKLNKTIAYFLEQWPNCLKTELSERPVFIFSAGWRSGSTLVQRLIISSGQVIIWGEPLGAAGVIPRLVHSCSFIDSQWPPRRFFPSNCDFQQLSNNWIANLTPEMDFLCSAHREFFLQWLKRPAVEKFGIERWGFKEVRLTIKHAKYLKMLFPEAKFVFVYRHPFSAYRSWRGNRWGDHWPGYCTYSPLIFARHWKRLLSGFLSEHDHVDGIMVKFEDLISGKFDLKMLSNHLGLENIESSILKKKIGSPTQSKIQKRPLSFLDKRVISLIAGRLMHRVGYEVSG